MWRVLLIFQDFCENYESVCELNYPSEVDILEMKLKQSCKSIKTFWINVMNNSLFYKCKKILIMSWPKGKDRSHSDTEE